MCEAKMENQNNTQNDSEKTDEQIWDELFNNPESAELLAQLTEQAQKEMKEGKFKEDKE